MPARIILLVEIDAPPLNPNPFAKLKIRIVVTTANRNETGVMSKKGKDSGSMNVSIAPSAAPAEMPRRPGSARLLRSIDCNTMPEHESDDPTSIELRTRGSLMSKIILLLVSSDGKKISETET